MGVYYDYNQQKRKQNDYGKCLVLPVNSYGPGARFSKAPETFRTRKAIFNSSVTKNREDFTPETSCIKGTSVHIKNL